MEKDNLYSRNTLYIDSIEQEEIKKCKIVIAGAGLGSNIAECALRLGFENILIIDGDKVEHSNLNRQNYLFSDIGKYKAEVIYHRLKDINPEANIQYEAAFIDESNMNKYIVNKDIAINTMDFTSRVPFLFDDCCVKKQIPVLHPYNLGWAGFVCVVNDERISMRTLWKEGESTELEMGKYIAGYLRFWGEDEQWLQGIIEKVKKQMEEGTHVMPQLAVSSWLTAGLTAQILFRLATHEPIEYYPRFYFLSAKNLTIRTSGLEN